jgi:ribose 5-phosphate isomerase B
MRKLLIERYGDNAADIRVTSGGTYAYSGVGPPDDAIDVANQYGIDLSGYKSRSIHFSTIETTDAVFCMTAQHKAHLVAKFPWYEDRIFILKQYAAGKENHDKKEEHDESEKYNVVDPIGQGAEVYKQVYEEIKDCLGKILDRWEQEKEFRMKLKGTYKIAIGSDHAGFLLKKNLIDFLKSLEHEAIDFGIDSNEQSADYPDYAKPVATAVAEGKYDYGVLICGSGVGMCITANRIKHARAILVSDSLTAKLSREHNNTNILCIGERFTTPMVAQDILKTWLATPFEGGRHEKRVRKIEPDEITS